MKKTIFSLMAGLVLALGAASCSENGEEPAPAPMVNQDGTVAYEIEAKTADDFRSRAEETYGDGSLATYLDWAIYEGTNKVPFKTSADAGAPQATVTSTGFKLKVNLDPNKTYKIFMLAHSQNQGVATYYVDYSSTEHYYDIELKHKNDDNPKRTDAFVGLFDLTPEKHSFTLYRIGTQLMIATDEDLSAFDLSKLTTEISLVNTASGNAPVVLNKYNDVDKGKTSPYNGTSLMTIQKASIHNGTTYTTKASTPFRTCRVIAIDHFLNCTAANLGANTAVKITFKNGTQVLGTKIWKPSSFDYAVRYVLVPKRGESLIGNSNEITVTKYTGFPGNSHNEVELD